MLGQTRRREQRCQTGHSEKNLRHRSHSIDLITGHYSYRSLTKDHTRSTLARTSDPRPRSSRQSIPIGHPLGNGLVQPIFRPASRRSSLVCFPSHSRRDAGLKMLCVKCSALCYILWPGRGTMKWRDLGNYIAPLCFRATATRMRIPEFKHFKSAPIRSP